MDSERFDELVMRFGSISLTRSRAIRGLAGGALALLTGATLLPDPTDARKKRSRKRRRKAQLQAQRAPQADAGKVTICHHTGSETNPIVKITVSANAAEAHVENHGDFIFGNCCEDSDCAHLDDECVVGRCRASDGNIGKCRREPTLGEPCDDGDLCTDNDRCVETDDDVVCQGTPRVCPDDGDPCTREICVAGDCVRRRVPGLPNGQPCQASVECCSGCCTVGPVGGSPFCTSTGPVPCLPPLP
jgi:hypothetical protein